MWPMTTVLTPHQIAAAEVRAELARRRIPQSALAYTLKMSEVSISRRLRGETPFDINELVAVAEFLQVPVTRLLPTTGHAA